MSEPSPVSNTFKMHTVANCVKALLAISIIACQAQSLPFSETLYELQYVVCVTDTNVHLSCHPRLQAIGCQYNAYMINKPHGKFASRYEYHWNSNGTEVLVGLPEHLITRWYTINVTCQNAARLCDFHVVLLNVDNGCNNSADAPKFTVWFPSKVLAFEGDYVDILCRAAAGGRSLPVTWYKDNTPLYLESSTLSGTSYRLEYNGTLLAFPHLKRSDVGRYTCEATNGTDVIRNTTLVGLARHLTFTKLPLNEIYINETEDLNVTCHAEGIPKPEVYWTFEGSVMSEVLNITTDGGRSVVLLLSDVQRSSDDGQYMCHAENGLEEITTTVQVHVNSIPPRPLVNLHIGDQSSSGRVSLVLTWHLPNDTDISHVPVLAVHMALYTVFTDGASSPDYIFPAHSHQLSTEVNCGTNYTMVVWLVNAMGHGPIAWLPFTTPPESTHQGAASVEGTVFERKWVPVFVGICVSCFVVTMIVIFIVFLWRRHRHPGGWYQQYSRSRTESETEACRNDESDPVANSGIASGFPNPLYEPLDQD